MQDIMRPTIRQHGNTNLPSPSPDALQACPVLALLGADAARGRLHAVHPTRPGDEGAATGFALALLQTLARTQTREPRPILWIQNRAGLLEAGMPYGPGLMQFGIDPHRIVIATLDTAQEALTATEMGLSLTGLAGVITELPGKLPAAMLKLGQRLALRAEATATACFLLHASATAVQMPVATRWRVAARMLTMPAQISPISPPVLSPMREYHLRSRKHRACSSPALALDLVKNRFGPETQLCVQWVPHAQYFVSLPSLPACPAPDPARGPDATHSGLVAAAAGDGPHRTDGPIAA
jgi:protein ImuA